MRTAITAPNTGVVASSGLERAAPMRIWLMFKNVQPTEKWMTPASEK